jgi:4-hydroxy-tetrahydrodipicolinate synthase
MPFMKGRPQHQDGNWSIELLDRLADIPNVVAIKEDAKVDDYTREIVNKISDRVAIVVSGNGLQQWSKVGDKCQAWLSGIGNLWPKVELDFHKHYLENNKEECDKIIENIEKPFFYVKDNYSWHLGIKSALEHLNLMSKQERMPYKELDEERHKHVGEIIEKIKKFKL